MATPLTILGANCLVWYDAAQALPIRTTPLAGGPAAPPAVTWAGTLTRTDVPYIEIDTAGTVLTAKFKWSLDGGATFQATGVATSATGVALGATGITATFPVGTYSVGHSYKALNSAVTDQSGNGWDGGGTTQSTAQILVISNANGQRGMKARSNASANFSVGYDSSGTIIGAGFSLPSPSVTPTYFYVVVTRDVAGGSLYGANGVSGGTNQFSTTDASGLIGIGGQSVTAAAPAVGTTFKLETLFSKTGAGGSYVSPLSAVGSSTGSATTDNIPAGKVTFGKVDGNVFGQYTYLEVIIANIAPTRSQRDQLNAIMAAKYGNAVIGVVTSSSASATQAQQSSMGRSFSIPGVTQAQIASAIKSVGMIRAAAQAQAPVTNKQIATAALTTAQSQKGFLGRSRSASATQSQVPSVRKALGVTKSSAQVQTAAVIRQAATIVSAAQAQAPAIRRAVSKTLGAAQSQLASCARTLLLHVTLSAAQSQEPAANRSFRMSVSAAQRQIGSAIMRSSVIAAWRTWYATARRRIISHASRNRVVSTLFRKRDVKGS